MKKKISALILSVICAVCAVCVLSGCGEENKNAEEPINTGELKTGEFYSLKEAYDNGFLTVSDLKNIAYYNNGIAYYQNPVEGYEDFTPIEIGELDEVTALSIRTDYLNDGGDTRYIEAGYTVDDVYIDYYYGSYNGCVAVMMDFGSGLHFQVEYEETVAGITFRYNELKHIQVWREEIRISKCI